MDSLAGMVTRLRAGNPRNRLISGTERDFFLSERFQTGCETHSVSCPIGTGASLPGGEGIGALKFATEQHVLPRLRINRTIAPVPYMPSWRAQGQFYV
jgi:hypothetical protein